MNHINAWPVWLVIALALPAQVRAQLAWDAERWTIEARESAIERYMGREGLSLNSGVAWLEGVELRNGIIEFDLAAKNQLGFYGIAFRAADAGDYEHFYLRPFQSGRPDATQYTPVYNGVSGWQVYTGPRHGLAVPIATDRWVHVRMVVRETRLEVEVDGELLVFPDLHRPVRAGGVGITSAGVPAHFANVVVTPLESPPVTGAPGADAPEPIPGLLTEWRVSSPFAEGRLDPAADLEPGEWDGLTWTSASPAFNGIVDLARYAVRTPEANTVFAVATVEARQAGPVHFRFGFSDRAVVYLNGRPIYRGRAEWRLRDHRFLGTVGLFDELVLPLEAGENEIRVAVSEDFGGWGVVAALTR